VGLKYSQGLTAVSSIISSGAAANNPIFGISPVSSTLSISSVKEEINVVLGAVSTVSVVGLAGYSYSTKLAGSNSTSSIGAIAYTKGLVVTTEITGVSASNVVGMVLYFLVKNGSGILTPVTSLATVPAVFPWVTGPSAIGKKTDLHSLTKKPRHISLTSSVRKNTTVKVVNGKR
jgi:hypothetical protein